MGAPAGDHLAAHDTYLATLAAAGDRRAFGELVRRHGGAVRALLRRMGADASLADDLAQDAFLAAFQHVRSFRGEGSFAGWIKQIAARLYIRRWRKRAELDPMADDPDAADEGAGGEGASVLRLDLDQAMKTLSPAERMCVSLCHGAGLSHPEIAEALNAPLGTVKSHVKRGLDKLRRHLTMDGATLGQSAADGA